VTNNNQTTILLAEDDQNDVMLIKRSFSKARIINPITCVDNGEQAIAYLKGEGRTPTASNTRCHLCCC